MEKLLTDSAIYPDSSVIKKALRNHYERYEKFIEAVSEKGLSAEWRYYNDSKSWLCRIAGRKKTVCWLSVWDTGFKLTFYFTEKTIEGVNQLNIKTHFEQAKPVGILFPVILNLDSAEKLNDAFKVLEYKLKVK
jgi:hypothetical protein